MPTKRASTVTKRAAKSAGRRPASRARPEPVEGLMLAIGPVVYVISRDDLPTFRLPDAVAKTALAALAKKPPNGKTPTPIVAGVRVSASGTAFGISSVLEHSIITNSRIH